jgi:hypothetical protein
MAAIEAALCDPQHLIAIVLSAAAVLYPGNAEKPNDSHQSIDSIRKSSRKEWLFFAFMIVVHGSMMVSIFRLGDQVTIDVITFQREACKTLVHPARAGRTANAGVFGNEASLRFWGVGGRHSNLTPFSHMMTRPLKHSVHVIDLTFGEHANSVAVCEYQ